MAGVFSGDFIYNDSCYCQLRPAFVKIKAITEMEGREYETYHNKTISIADG